MLVKASGCCSLFLGTFLLKRKYIFILIYSIAVWGLFLVHMYLVELAHYPTLCVPSTQWKSAVQKPLLCLQHTTGTILVCISSLKIATIYYKLVLTFGVMGENGETSGWFLLCCSSLCCNQSYNTTATSALTKTSPRGQKNPHSQSARQYSFLRTRKKRKDVNVTMECKKEWNAMFFDHNDLKVILLKSHHMNKQWWHHAVKSHTKNKTNRKNPGRQKLE